MTGQPVRGALPRALGGPALEGRRWPLSVILPVGLAVAGRGAQNLLGRLSTARVGDTASTALAAGEHTASRPGRRQSAPALPCQYWASRYSRGWRLHEFGTVHARPADP